MAPRDRWDDWRSFPASVPRRADGIKARSQRGAIGDTWWSQRWIGVLESFNLGGRLTRGKRYARAGQVLSLTVEPGQVTASVQGSRVKPYRVRIGVGTLVARDWERVLDAMAAKAVWLAKLLAGEMPTDIEDVFVGCSLSLFPGSARDLTTSCSCPDWSNPCKHIAAVYYLLAEAFDDDPWLIFRWRGRDKAELLDGLRARRSPRAVASRGARGSPVVDDQDGWPTVPAHHLGDPIARWWAAGPELGDVVVRRRAPAASDVVLRQADPIDVVVDAVNLADVLRPLYAAIVERALEAP